MARVSQQFQYESLGNEHKERVRARTRVNRKEQWTPTQNIPGQWGNRLKPESPLH